MKSSVCISMIFENNLLIRFSKIGGWRGECSAYFLEWLIQLLMISSNSSGILTLVGAYYYAKWTIRVGSYEILLTLFAS